MWRAYAEQTAGINIIFHNAWEVVAGTNQLYKKEDKEQCIKAILENAYDIYKKTNGEYNQRILKSLKIAVNNMRFF